LSATQSAAVMAETVPIHFNQVVMEVEYTVHFPRTPPLYLDFVIAGRAQSCLPGSTTP
jgi:hypothetical protein